MKTKSLHLLFLLTTILILSNSCNNSKINTKETVKEEQPEQTFPKLFLLSKGLTTDTLREEFLDFIEKEPVLYAVAVVVNASSTEKKKQKKTEKVKIQFEAMGFDTSKVKLFDLMKTPPQKLSEFDIIYILGGNPFLLLDEVNKSGARAVLKELAYQDKILMGYSAGALLLGPDLNLMNYADPLLGFNEMGLKELSCIGLYDFYIFPHYTDFTSQVPELITIIQEYEAQSDLAIYRLNDNQGIRYQNGIMKIIGK